MKLQEQIERLMNMHKRMCHEDTGSPEDFATSLHISKRHLFNVIEEFKIMGAPIQYDKSRQTYYYTQEYEIKLEATFQLLSQKEIIDISGGFISKCNFISSIPFNFASS